MSTVSLGEGLVTISSGTIDDDDYEDIFLELKMEELDTGELRYESTWYLQKHEAECIISALKVALSALDENDRP